MHATSNLAMVLLTMVVCWLKNYGLIKPSSIKWCRICTNRKQAKKFLGHMQPCRTKKRSMVNSLTLHGLSLIKSIFPYTWHHYFSLKYNSFCTHMACLTRGTVVLWLYRFPVVERLVAVRYVTKCPTKQPYNQKQLKCSHKRRIPSHHYDTT